MEVSAVWTDDCHGKKDFDGNILVLSSRMHPRGGGFLSWTADKAGAIVGGIQTNADRPFIPPSATSEIHLRYGSPEGDRYVILAKGNFTGQTEDEVKEKVEVWARERFTEIVDLLRVKYPIPPAT